MPQLIQAYVPAVFLARMNISFAAAGLNATNTRILYLIGSPVKSWDPNSAINVLSGLEYNKGYLIEPIADIVLAEGIVQTEICEEQNPGTVPMGFVVTKPLDIIVSGTQPSVTHSDLIGDVRITILTRDGDTYSVIEKTDTNTPADLSPKLQVLFDKATGTVYAHPDNPFADTEVIHIVYEKAVLPA